MDTQAILAEALSVVAHHEPALVLVYGSFAAGTQTATSDVDLIVFAPVATRTHQADTVANHPLDAWIHPLADLKKAALFTRIVPCRALHDPDNLLPGLVRRVEARRRKESGPLAPAEAAQLEAWVAKMLVRAAVDDMEGDYRYRWLVQDFPELWCRWAGRFYDGPKKTLALLAVEAPEVRDLLAGLLRGPKDLTSLTRLYSTLGEFRRLG